MASSFCHVVDGAKQVRLERIVRPRVMSLWLQRAGPVLTLIVLLHSTNDLGALRICDCSNDC